MADLVAMVAFVRARLGEEEATWRREQSEGLGADTPWMVDRMLREVEATRAIVDDYAPVARNDDGSHEPEYAYGWAEGLGLAVRALAAIWRDHPDYDPAWALET